MPTGTKLTRPKPLSSTDKRGLAAELVAETWFVGHGYHVYRPVSYSTSVDLLVQNPEGEYFRVQVKTLRRKHWVDLKRSYQADSFDALFAVDLSAGRSYLLPWEQIYNGGWMNGANLSRWEEYRVQT